MKEKKVNELLQESLDRLYAAWQEGYKYEKLSEGLANEDDEHFIEWDKITVTIELSDGTSITLSTKEVQEALKKLFPDLAKRLMVEKLKDKE